jgi:hypothetical protein
MSGLDNARRGLEISDKKASPSLKVARIEANRDFRNVRRSVAELTENLRLSILLSQNCRSPE